MILLLEKRGCDFFTDDKKEKSDVGNYRVGTYNYSIHGKNGRDYILEFTCGNKYRYRKNHKITGRPLLHPIKELVNDNALYIDTEFQELTTCGTSEPYLGSFRDIRLERELDNMNLSFTQADILKAVNTISKEQYDKILFY